MIRPQVLGAWLSLVLLSLAIETAAAGDASEASPQFLVGVAKRDITPPIGMPMWGYGARHDALSVGVMDPLWAKCIVIAAGKDRVALVGTDLGRGPTVQMMQQIRQQLHEVGIEHVLITGSHSHHGPVIELTDREGYGKGRFDVAVKYAQQLPEQLVAVILEANKNLQPAKVGVGKRNVTLNRNRHTKREPRVTDPMLAVIRFDSLEGQPLAVLTNFAAHPVMTEESDLRYSADYVGAMHAAVEEALQTTSVFMQGAAGDMSPNSPSGVSGPQQFGRHLGGQVVEIAKSISTAAPAKPSIEGRVDHWKFATRVKFSNPWIQAVFARAFFPELTRNIAEEWANGITAELDTVLINDQIALVGGSGEFFCNHSNRLKERAYVEHTLFCGYCNGHNLYFPTIEAASEGGYGADPTVSPVELGAGEQMMNRALQNLYIMLDKFQGDAAVGFQSVPQSGTP
ncbi:MAG: neutral/alkaline non-lysosomal ceramidase N-terminal domain-containing protein [Pirellulales bacterium]|nr:neutral/alkaline non-lysosomal ceramidase N-terminal domain-containing protein [Pirellulales bacterium]